MRNSRWLLLWLIWALIAPLPSQAQDDPRAALQTAVNAARLGEGLPPLSESTLLSQAAQQRADELAAHPTETLTEPKPNYTRRIRETGYRAWDEGLMVEEIVWAGMGGADEAFRWFHSNTWHTFTDARYREFGVGYATDTKGTHYFVVTFGSRPGVLPIFINDGAATTDSPQVALHLTNEEAEPLGDGSWPGKAIEVRISNTPNFDNAEWQPWEMLLPWLLEGTEPGEYAVYVEFRDGAGRTAISEDTIQLVAEGETAPTPTPHHQNPTATPSATIPPTASATAAPTETPPPQATGTPAPLSPTATPTPPPPPATPTSFPTWTPLPTPATTAPAHPTDWPVLLALGLEGAAVLLAVAAFLRRGA